MAQRVAGGAVQGRMNRRFLLLAILLGVLSAVLVYVRISGNEGDGTAAPAAVGDQQVVVAATAIKQRTTITPEMVELKTVPGSAVATGALTDLESVIGKVTKFPIEANQQVLASSIVATDRPAENASLAQFVPVGRRAVAIKASQIINAGGLVLPGDWVDIGWSCCDSSPVVSSTLLRNVQVAAIATTLIPSGPVTNPTQGAGDTTTDAPVAAEAVPPDPGAATVTLLVTPQEAQLLHLAEQRGEFRLTLRGIGDQDTTDTGYTTVYDILPREAVAALADVLRPDGYKDGQQ